MGVIFHLLFSQVGTVYQLIITISILISQVLGMGSVLGNEAGWPILLGLTIVPGILQVSLDGLKTAVRLLWVRVVVLWLHNCLMNSRSWVQFKLSPMFFETLSPFLFIWCQSTQIKNLMGKKNFFKIEKKLFADFNQHLATTSLWLNQIELLSPT